MATTNVNVYSLNVNGLHNSEKRVSIINWLQMNFSGITFLQEVHSTEDCEQAWKKDFKDYNIYFSHGSGNARGVCTIIPMKYDFKHIETVKDENGRFLLLHLQFNGNDLVIVNIYGPTKNFQEQQQEFISYISGNLMHFMGKQIIIGGDFNIYMDPVLDKKGGCIETCCKSADMLRSLMTELNLCDIYRIQHPNLKRFTWRNKGRAGWVQSIYLFGVLRRFQHCTGHITMGSWKGRGNQYI